MLEPVLQQKNRQGQYLISHRYYRPKKGKNIQNFNLRAFLRTERHRLIRHPVDTDFPKKKLQEISY